MAERGVSKNRYFDNVEIENIEKSMELLKKSRFTGRGVVYQRSNFLFEVDQHMIESKKDINKYRWKGLLTEGAGLLIDGKPKCMKSTIAAMMTAAALNLNNNGIYQNFKCNMNPNKQILWFDTEQTVPQFNKMQLNIMRWAGLEEPPLNYHAFSLVQFQDPIEKIFMILKVLKDLLYYGRKDRLGDLIENDQIGLIVLDVISDLVADENDRIQVNQLFDLIGKIQAETGTMVIYTLHQNKGDDKPTGIIGGKMEKKASGRIMCNRKGEDDAGPVYVRHKFNREGGELFNPFFVNYDEAGFPIIVDNDISQIF